MITRRQKRINELLREELLLLVPGRLDDPRLVPVTVTRVEVTQDLGTAKVYFTVQSGEDESLDEILAGLRNAEGFLRGELGGLGLRRLPRLVFAHDRDFESGERVLDILARLGRDSGPAASAEGEAEGEGDTVSEGEGAGAGEGEGEGDGAGDGDGAGAGVGEGDGNSVGPGWQPGRAASR